jgi:restriction system protein
LGELFLIAHCIHRGYQKQVVPPFQELMLPMLRLAAESNGQPLAMKVAVEKLATAMGLSEEDRSELLPSGRQSRFTNRIAWAASHLRAAKLLESAGRGLVVITDRGKELLASNPPAINLRTLMQFPEFQEFRGGNNGEQVPDKEAESTDTPEEAIEKSYRALRAEIVADVLARLKTCTPAFFEQIVVQLVVRMGYGGSGEAVGKSHDGGIDGVIKQDKLGLDVVYLQAKRWENTVGRHEVQQFAGALAGQQANRGVFITTSDFSSEAVAYANKMSPTL